MARTTLIAFRRDTAANWTSTNPTLSAGEPGFETDTGKVKIGDGSTAWASLAYLSGGGGSPTGSAGGDLGGTYPNPTVAAIHETSGPTKLTVGTINNGDYLTRSGSTLIGGSPTPGGPPTGAAGGDLSGTYPNPGVAKVAGNTVPIFTTGSSPPGSPVDGDYWIYPADGTNGVFWLFQYVSAETTYKWRFVGGSSIFFDSVPNSVLNTNTQVGATGYYYASAAAYTTVRAGDYRIWGTCAFDSNGGSASHIDLVAFHGSSQGGFMRGAVWNTGVATSASLSLTTLFQGLSASVVIGLCCSSGVNGTYKLVEQQVNIQPVRVI